MHDFLKWMKLESTLPMLRDERKYILHTLESFAVDKEFLSYFNLLEYYIYRLTNGSALGEDMRALKAHKKEILDNEDAKNVVHKLSHLMGNKILELMLINRYGYGLFEEE